MQSLPRPVALAAMTIATSAFWFASGAGGREPPLVSGGAGKVIQLTMHAPPKDYRLRIAFVEAGTGAGLSGVTAVITREEHAGELHSADCRPLFFVAAGRGLSKISAKYEGVTLSQKVDLRRGPRDLFFRWPAV